MLCIIIDNQDYQLSNGIITTGVLLFLESGRDSLSGSIVANNSLLLSGNLSSDYGLAC